MTGGDQLGGHTSDLLSAIVDCINLVVLQGKVPQWMCHIFYGAQLIALSKPNNGVRPIAIGLTLRRIAGKSAMAKLQDMCGILFQPHRLGVGVARRAEIAVHAVRRFLEHEHSTPTATVKIDYTLT